MDNSYICFYINTDEEKITYFHYYLHLYMH